MPLSDFLTNFIWLSDWTLEDDADSRIVCFRKYFSVDEMSEWQKRLIRISADSCYKVFVNGSFVQEGPQKALCLTEWYVDEFDIGPWLREGENAIAVEVLRYTAERPGTDVNRSLLRSNTPFLYVQDDCADAGKSLSAKCGWKARRNDGIRIIGETGTIGPAPIHVQEDVTADQSFAGWKQAGFHDEAWEEPKLYTILDVWKSQVQGSLIPRTIPPMWHEDGCFTGVSAVRECGDTDIKRLENQYNAMLSGNGIVIIPPRARQIVEISARELRCGFLRYRFLKGAGSTVKTTCAESYVYPQPDVFNALGASSPQAPKKGDRTDAEKGAIVGHTSFYHVAGYGTDDQPEEYEPFWFRTFRYIRLEIETGDQPLILNRFSYRSTGYPLEVKTSFTSPDAELSLIWDISLRTLRLCMHETYMDCPFYEQLQYAMDTRSEILYTYAISADDRLARAAMEAFRLSQRADGLLSASAPFIGTGVIPGFSIYYILMVHDHMMYFGDRALVRRHLPAIDGILGFFERNVGPTGIVKKIGGSLLRHVLWSFIDWSNAWNGGMPNAANQGTGALTMESLLYLYGLQKAAELAEYAGRSGLAQEYTDRANALSSAIRTTCSISFEKADSSIFLLTDGPGIAEYSVHSQAFGVLTGVLTREEGASALRELIGNEKAAQPTVAFMFYVFRALEECGCYEKTFALWDPWRRMLRENLTTCVENDTDMRSDCHAWGSLLLYELPSVLLGVRPAAPGYEKTEILPPAPYPDWIKGDVVTQKGIIHVGKNRLKPGIYETERLLI